MRDFTASLIHSVIFNAQLDRVYLNLRSRDEESFEFLNAISLLVRHTSGRKCNEVDSCVSRPCKNNGVCSSGPGGRFSCQCRQGFTDATCSTDIDECRANQPCRNGGTCVNSIGTYRQVNLHLRDCSLWKENANLLMMANQLHHFFLNLARIIIIGHRR